MIEERSTLLLLHPDGDIRRHFSRAIEMSDCRITINSCSRISPGDLVSGQYQLIIGWDNYMVDDATSLLQFYRTHAELAPIIFISSDASPQNAVAAIRAGACDFLVNDAEAALIVEGVRHALRHRTDSSTRANHREGDTGKQQIISCSKKMQVLVDLADRVARSNATILIHGESGTGKELLARYIHDHSGRSRGRMVAMNCAALPEQLVESELFGYEKGAFTGAVSKRQGRFEQADHGTLLLDEISEMPIQLQAKLLRVLQEKEIDPVGGNRAIPVDVRVIATTNKDLFEMVQAGSFREDLYYRLRVVPLSLPPLRERPDDIPLLAQFFIEKHGPSNAKDDARFTKPALDLLRTYPWPGNVRELENTVMRSLLISPDANIAPEHLLLDEDNCPGADANRQTLVGLTVQDVEKELIHQTLKHVNQNRTHAAKMLGISIRTLRNKLNAYKQSQAPPADMVAEG